eukprot:403367296
MSININGPAFYKKLKKFAEYWKKSEKPQSQNSEDLATKYDFFLFVLGKVTDQDIQKKTQILHTWLLSYQFSETVFLFLKDTFYVLTSQQKKQLLESLKVPEGYDGPKLKVILRDTKGDQLQVFKNFIQQAIGDLSNIKREIGSFSTENPDGTFAQDFKKNFSKHFPKIPIKDCSKFFEEILLTKDEYDLESVKISSLFSGFMMKQLITECEEIIESNSQENHDKIAAKLESILDKQDEMQKFKKLLPEELKKDYDPQCHEFQYSPSVQSGGTYNIRMGAPNNNKPLSSDTILLSICTKYKDISTNISRTLIINHDDERKAAYEFMTLIFKHATEQLKSGVKCGEVYQAVIDKIKELGKDEYIKFMPSILGQGIGMFPKEDQLQIMKDNHRVLEDNMVINLKFTIANFSTQPTRNCLILADTILIKGQTPQVLTNKVKKDYPDISYTIDEFDDVDENENTNATNTKANNSKKQSGKQQINTSTVVDKQKASKVAEKIARGDKIGVIQGERLRNHQNLNINADDDKRKADQIELFKLKQEELKQRLEDGDIKFGGKQGNQAKDLDSVHAYKNSSEFPKEARNFQFCIDKNKHCILVPFKDENGNIMMAPFHILTIKNASISTENNISYLRLNFHCPGQGLSSKEVNFPSMKGPQQAYIKELTVQSNNSQQLNTSLKILKEVQKVAKLSEINQKKSNDLNDEEQHLADEALIISKQKKVVLDNVHVKPTLAGKKTVGALETHINGFRFMSSKGQKLDITFRNIKHAFYQPCKKDLIVLLHFRLRVPIIVGNKKVVDIQFYTEICALVDDLDSRGAARRRMNEQDEHEQEIRENQNRLRLNDKYHKFCQNVETFAKENRYDIEFDIPYKKLEFAGCHTKSSVKMIPTEKCLVALSEVPFFVMDLSEVEIAHFERVSFMTRNFDLVFLHKDYQTFKRISTIPNEEDFSGFVLNDGGWNFLCDQQGSDENQHSDDEENSDSEYNESEDEEVGSDNSESEDDSEFSKEASDAESSDVNPDEEEEEEGMDWDELEKQAMEEEKIKNDLAKTRLNQENAMKKAPSGNYGGGKKANGNQLAKASGMMNPKNSMIGRIPKRR